MIKEILDIFGNVLHYRRCTVEDVYKHFKCVRRVVDPKDREAYKVRMIESVNVGTAYCIDDSNVFLYYLKETKKVSKGVSFSWVGKPVECCALLSAMFAIEDTDTDFIKFLLHEKSNIDHFKTLLHKESLQYQTTYPKQAVIHIHNLRKTFKFLGVI